jgi:hypothetical protein
MDGKKIIDISKTLNDLEYEERRDVYQSVFSLGYLASEEMNDRLVLISLIALVYQKMKVKEKDITPLVVLLKITGQKEKDSYYQFLESLAIIVEDFSYGIKKIDACGLKTSQEIINRIKELLSTWIPF